MGWFCTEQVPYEEIPEPLHDIAALSQNIVVSAWYDQLIECLSGSDERCRYRQCVGDMDIIIHITMNQK